MNHKAHLQGGRIIQVTHDLSNPIPNTYMQIGSLKVKHITPLILTFMFRTSLKTKSHA
jgi:hypothetical protein